MVNDSTWSRFSAVVEIQHGSAKYAQQQVDGGDDDWSDDDRTGVGTRLRRTSVRRGCAGGSFVSVAYSAWKKRINIGNVVDGVSSGRVSDTRAARADNYLFMLMSRRCRRTR